MVTLRDCDFYVTIGILVLGLSGCLLVQRVLHGALVFRIAVHPVLGSGSTATACCSHTPFVAKSTVLDNDNTK